MPQMTQRWLGVLCNIVAEQELILLQKKRDNGLIYVGLADLIMNPITQEKLTLKKVESPWKIQLWWKMRDHSFFSLKGCLTRSSHNVF